MNYPRDVLMLRYGRINDGALRFSRRPRRAAAAAAEATVAAPAARERARG
jgi:hypothetical protein